MSSLSGKIYNYLMSFDLIHLLLDTYIGHKVTVSSLEISPFMKLVGPSFYQLTSRSQAQEKVTHGAPCFVFVLDRFTDR